VAIDKDLLTINSNKCTRVLKYNSNVVSTRIC